MAWAGVLQPRSARPRFDTVNVTVPAYVSAYDAQLGATPLATWKAYLRYHVADSYAGALPHALRRRDLRLPQRHAAGREGAAPALAALHHRDRSVAARRARQSRTSRSAFSPAAKARALALVTNLQGVLRDDIRTLAWMSPPTRARAVVKLDAFTKKIGYPDRWEDYSTLTVADGRYAANVEAVRAWNDARTLARIGTPTDRGRWGMTPPTVNAYYNPSNDEIVFPAGILQPPFFNARPTTRSTTARSAR